MKNSRLAVWCSAGSLSLFLAAAACAQESPAKGFYFKADAGGGVIEDVKVKEFFGVKDAGKFKFDPGPRLDIGVGYQFTPWFSAEFETGAMYNTIREERGSSLSSVPLMVNAVIHIPTRTRFVPFLGIGGGGVVSVLDADFLINPKSHEGVHLNGTQSDLIAAWQGFAGLRYNVNERFNISVAYRYLGVDEHSWDVHGEPAPFGPLPEHFIKLGRIDSHAIVLGVTLHF